MEKTELLPCPFCGSDEITVETDDGRGWQKCKSCYATGPVFSKYTGEEGEDYISWNTRAPGNGDIAVSRECAEYFETLTCIECAMIGNRDPINMARLEKYQNEIEHALKGEAK